VATKHSFFIDVVLFMTPGYHELNC